MTTGLLMAATAATGATAATSQGAARPLSVYPTAGTAAASPQTWISFRGAGPAELGGISVRGSRTGVHSGRLIAQSDGNGAAFAPGKPFAPGETVTVHANRPLAGSTGRAVTFRIGVLRSDPSTYAAGSGGTSPGGGSDGGSKFHSVAGFRPPSIDVLTRKRGRAKGDVFLAPKSGQRAAMIVDDAGKLLWYRPAPHGFRIYDFRKQRYHGRSVLTWFEWRNCSSSTCGVGRIYDDTYHQVDSVRAAHGYAADFHDFTLSPQNTAYLLVQLPVQANLKSVGGPSNGTMYDFIVQEIDIPTGTARFEWHALGHIPLRESGLRYSSGIYDPYHLNSVDQESNGNLLVSARNTNTVYELDRATGSIIWRLGGKKSSFKMGHGARFIAQHDVRRLRNGDISIFDNGSGAGLGNRASRGLVLSIHGSKASVVRELRRAHAVYAQSQGNVQALPNGDYFVGWGGQMPYFSEFDSGGRLVYDAQFSGTVGNTYRAFRFGWRGHPTDPPAVAARASKGKTKLWVSWNGATQVAKWQVFAGSDSGSLAYRKTISRSDFETSTTLKGEQQFVEVRALNSHNSVLATSGPVGVLG